MTFTQRPLAILFDLDGTLVDSAPDLAAAVNLMRQQRGLPLTPYEQLRKVASAGARGLIGAAFGTRPDDPDYEALRKEFLANYVKDIATRSQLFPKIRELLTALETQQIQWGIVTNKVEKLTHLFVPKIGLDQAGCIVCGDTTPHAKPHPAPLLEAARRLRIAPKKCWYVGDDLRDIQAGQAAGMATIAAAWGYCGNSHPTSWQADTIMNDPLQILTLLNKTSIIS